MAKSYRDLDIWKNGIEIANDIYSVTKKFPKDETFGLAIQMRKSAVSIPSNIAEGFARQYNKEYKQFLYVALGSCSELETQIIVGAEQRYYLKETKDKLLEKLDHESRMIMNMIKAVSGSLKYTNYDGR